MSLEPTEGGQALLPGEDKDPGCLSDAPLYPASYTDAHGSLACSAFIVEIKQNEMCPVMTRASVLLGS